MKVHLLIPNGFRRTFGVTLLPKAALKTRALQTLARSSMRPLSARSVWSAARSPPLLEVTVISGQRRDGESVAWIAVASGVDSNPHFGGADFGPLQRDVAERLKSTETAPRLRR